MRSAKHATHGKGGGSAASLEDPVERRVGDITDAAGRDHEIGRREALRRGGRGRLAFKIGDDAGVEQSGGRGVLDRILGAIDADHGDVGARRLAGEELRVALEQRSGVEPRELRFRVTLVKRVDRKVVFQERGVDAVGAADVDEGRNLGAARLLERVDDGVEDRSGLLGNAIAKTTEGREIRPRIGMIVDVVEGRFAVVDLVVKRCTGHRFSFPRKSRLAKAPASRRPDAPKIPRPRPTGKSAAASPRRYVMLAR